MQTLHFSVYLASGLVGIEPSHSHAKNLEGGTSSFAQLRVNKCQHQRPAFAIIHIGVSLFEERCQKFCWLSELKIHEHILEMRFSNRKISRPGRAYMFCSKYIVKLSGVAKKNCLY